MNHNTIRSKRDNIIYQKGYRAGKRLALRSIRQAARLEAGEILRDLIDDVISRGRLGARREDLRKTAFLRKRIGIMEKDLSALGVM